MRTRFSPLVDEVDTVAARGGVHIAGHARLRQVLFAERQEGHRAFRDLPALLKIEQTHGVQSHIAVIRHGERESEFAVVDEIIIPFLDAQRRDLHVRAAVFLHERAGKAGAGEIALFVEQRAPGVVISVCRSIQMPSLRWARMSRPRNSSHSYSPASREGERRAVARFDAGAVEIRGDDRLFSRRAGGRRAGRKARSA